MYPALGTDAPPTQPHGQLTSYPQLIIVKTHRFKPGLTYLGVVVWSLDVHWEGGSTEQDSSCRASHDGLALGSARGGRSSPVDPQVRSKTHFRHAAIAVAGSVVGPTA